MKIRGCTIHAFGQFREFSVPAVDSDFVVVHGPNEAGKSTFFHFLSSMLYGLRPVDLSKHPYAPRDGSPISGRMLYVTGAGQEIVVERALRSTPSGRLALEGDGLFGSEHQIRNQPLPEVAHMTERVFHSVYALNLADMAGVEDRAWETIQDRLLGGLTSDVLRPARAVVAELTEEAGKLWRPTRRGVTVSQQLEDRVRELRTASHSARDSDQRLRDLARELKDLDAAYTVLDDRRTELRTSRRRSDRLAPVHSALEHISRLRERAGDAADLDGLPPAPTDVLRSLAAEIDADQESARKIEARLDELRVVEESADESDVRIVERAGEIRYWPGRLKLYSERLAQLEEVRREIERLDTRVADLSASLMLPESTDGQTEKLADLPMTELRLAMRRLEQAVSAREMQAAQLSGVRQHQAGRLQGAMVVLLGVSLVLAAIGLYAGIVGLWAPAIGFVAFGLAQLLVHRFGGSRIGASKSRLDAAEGVVKDRRDVVRSILSALPVRPDRMDDPGADLVSDLEALRSAVGDREFARKNASRLEDAVRSDLDQLAALCTVCGVESGGDAAASVARLEVVLKMAEQRADAARTAVTERASQEDDLGRLEDQVERLRREREALEMRVKQFGTSVEDGLKEIEERRQAHRSADALMEDLNLRHPDWEALRDEHSELVRSGQGATLSDRDRQELEDELERIELDVKELQFRRGEVQKEIETGQRERSSADIQSEIEDLSEELRRVRLERDRLMLLASIVRRADTLFRERHQPDVLRLAGEYLAVLTEGRYARLYVDEVTAGLQVLDATDEAPVPVAPPLSRGTMDQIHLAFRLALASHLDSGQERLPVFFDEILVNWDERRRQRAYGLLGQLSKERQVFFFTCHEWLVRELGKEAGAEPVLLESAVMPS